MSQIGGQISNYNKNINEYSDIIRLKSPQKTLDKLIFNSLMFYFRFINKHRKKRMFAKFIQQSNVIFSSSLIRYFSREFNLELVIPQKVQNLWRLK